MGRKKNEITRLKNDIKSKWNGTLLSNKITENNTIRIRCERNHIFEISIDNYDLGHFCPNCVRDRKMEKFGKRTKDVTKGIFTFADYGLEMFSNVSQTIEEKKQPQMMMTPQQYQHMMYIQSKLNQQ